MRKPRNKPYRIIGAYDSETCNIKEGLHYSAFPILHQLGLLNAPIEDIGPDNVEDNCSIELYRHSVELFARLNEIAASDQDYIPVIACHNLAFDMYGLSPWLDGLDNVRVLAKSKRKPITFTICDERNRPRLVLWDTLVFSQQSLSRMGRDCGYVKADGEWNYTLTRTPETPLTDNEIIYAKRDVYALLAWLGWWLRRNPDIEPMRLGLNVVTKTGVVRERRRVRFDQETGIGNKYNIGRFWHYLNKKEMPKTDDELYTMHACTRGGFTFCSSVNASKPFDLGSTDYTIAAFDATSQHPAQMVSHLYPTGFHETSVKALDYAFRRCGNVSVDYVLKNWVEPFHTAFYAAFEFDNLRIRKGSIFEKYGIAPLASARITGEVFADENDTTSNAQFHEHMEHIGYQDTAVNPKFAFGKLVEADKAILFLTELAAWEVWQAYEWNDVHALGGYLTNRFIKPSDMSIVSVMQFYSAKNAFKHAREMYYNLGTIDNSEQLISLGVAPAIVRTMENGTISDSDVDNEYLRLKSDLNALFGIEASNEFRQNTILLSSGIEYEQVYGIANAPKNPKAWYQFGQRIVGWSRIAQIVTMQLASKHVETVVNGDTDSVKFLVKKSKLKTLEHAISHLGAAIDNAKRVVMSRAKAAYPRFYDPLDGIGHYVLEFTASRFCASWNKAYCTQEIDNRDGKLKFAFTLAGIPARLGVNQAADQFYSEGWSFEKICNLFLGYNVEYDKSVIGMNGRSFPEWGSAYVGMVEDYRGNGSMVCEPRALALFPMSKVVNDTRTADNAQNLRYAMSNNPDVNKRRLLLYKDNIGRYKFADMEVHL